MITADVSCAPCHPQGAKFQKERVYDQHNKILDIAANANLKAVNTIEKALATEGADKELIKKAQDAHRKAFLYFDWISTTNSMGFHNPRKQLSF